MLPWLQRRWRTGQLSSIDVNIHKFYVDIREYIHIQRCLYLVYMY